MKEEDSGPDLVNLLTEARLGDPRALETVVSIVYEELRSIAHRQLGRLPSSGTLNTTAVVHEAYVKLARDSDPNYEDRSHFLAIAAKAMRQIIIDYARKQHALKRGGTRHRVPLDGVQIPVDNRIEELIALDRALEKLSGMNPRLTLVVECRFFGGLTEKETGDALSVDERTVRRDWTKAKAWLFRELAP